MSLYEVDVNRARMLYIYRHELVSFHPLQTCLWWHICLRTLNVTTASYQCLFLPLTPPSALLLLLSHRRLSHRGFVLKQVCSPAVPQLIFHQSERCSESALPGPNKALCSPFLWPHALGKQRLTDYKGEDRMGRALVMYCSLKYYSHWQYVYFRGKQVTNWTYTLILGRNITEIIRNIQLNSVLLYLPIADTPQGKSWHVIRTKRAMLVSSKHCLIPDWVV